MQILSSHHKSPDSAWMLISPLWVDQICKYSSQPPFFSFTSPGEFVFVYMKSKAFFLETFILGHERETSRQSQDSAFHTTDQLQIYIQAPSLLVLLPHHAVFPSSHTLTSSYMVVTLTGSWLCFLAHAVSFPFSRMLSPFLIRRPFSPSHVMHESGIGIKSPTFSFPTITTHIKELDQVP